MDNLTTQQGPIATFTVDVLRRILTILTEHGNFRMTNLAGKAGLNFQVCKRYVSFMKTLGWVDLVQEDEDNKFVSVTPVGRRIGIVLTDFVEGRDADTIDYTNAPGRLYEQPKAKSQQALLPAPVELDQVRGSIKRGTRILLIDDEPDVALTYKSFLTAEGYTVDAFKEPEKAVEHFIAARPKFYDLVITDIRMREMNGLRLYQVLKNIDPSVKVIFVTALDAADELVSMISPAPVQVLKKPVDKKMFSQSVRSALLAAT